MAGYALAAEPVAARLSEFANIQVSLALPTVSCRDDMMNVLSAPACSLQPQRSAPAPAPAPAAWLVVLLAWAMSLIAMPARAESPEVLLGRNILTNGDFSKLDDHKMAAGWTIPPNANVMIMSEKGNPYLRIAYVQDYIPRKASQVIAVQPGWKTLTALGRFRSTGIVPARQNRDYCMEMILHYLDDKGADKGYGQSLVSTCFPFCGPHESPCSCHPLPRH